VIIIAVHASEHRILIAFIITLLVENPKLKTKYY
jgi:hypothetical protein